MLTLQRIRAYRFEGGGWALPWVLVVYISVWGSGSLSQGSGCSALPVFLEHLSEAFGKK